MDSIYLNKILELTDSIYVDTKKGVGNTKVLEIIKILKLNKSATRCSNSMDTGKRLDIIIKLLDKIYQSNFASLVTNSTNIALLTNDSNWTNNLYTGTTITGQSVGDWYDSGTILYHFITSTMVSRIPYSSL